MKKNVRKLLINHALKAGLTTAVIDGVIQYFMLRNKVPIPITVDAITNQVDTVMGAAVALAITLAMILTVVNYATLKYPKVPFLPVALWLVIKHGFFAFGVTTSLAVLWQRFFGTVTVDLPVALLIICIVAGSVSAMVNYLTIKACLISEIHS